MGTIYPVVTTSGTYDGSGITLSINCQDYPGNRWEYREYTRGPRVTVTPIAVVLGPGETMQFTAMAVDAAGVPIVDPAFAWSVDAGGLGSITPTGLYTAPAAIASDSSDNVRCTLQGQNAWALNGVILHP